MRLDTTQAQRTGVVDIGRVLDDGPWSMTQRIMVILAALTIVADGFDGQLIGFAIPSIIAEWGVTRGDFAPAVAAGLVGMAIGSAFAGFFADRFGRRVAAIGSVLLFSLATFAIGFSTSLTMLATLRFIAGLGIGGALPSATTITAEYTPARHRTMAITAAIVCVPLGGMLAGVFASYILPSFGWRYLFWLGGAIPLALAVLLMFQLKESPRYLAHRQARWPELERLLARMSRPIPAGTTFIDSHEANVGEKAGFAALFKGGRARDTVALWIACFACLLAVYSAFSWLPSMLTNEGLSSGVASAGLTAYNLGGVVGALICAAAITRFGSRWPLAIFAAGGAISAFWLMGVDPKAETSTMIAGIGIHGLFVTTVQCIIYSLLANVYPTNIRATGTASTLAFGRLGAILSAFAGSAIISYGGAQGYFALLAGSLVIVLIGLWMVRAQIRPVSQKTAPKQAIATTEARA